MTPRKYPAVELTMSKRSRTLVNRTVGRSLSFVDSTEVGMVDADTDRDVVDLDVIDAMVKRYVSVKLGQRGAEAVRGARFV